MPRHDVHRSFVLLVVLATACNGASGHASTTGSEDADADAGENTSDASGMGTTGSTPPSTCEGSEACGDDLVCVAPWDPGTGERGDAACVPSCVHANALDRWCIDDASCCEGLRCNEVDGFCSPLPGDTSGGSTDTDGETETGSGTDTAMTTTGASSSSSSTGTGTGTGTTGDATTG